MHACTYQSICIYLSIAGGTRESNFALKGTSIGRLSQASESAGVCLFTLWG